MAKETEPTASSLAEFLRLHRDQILEQWQRAVKDRPASRGLTLGRLIDHIPELLAAIASAGEERLDDPDARLATESAERHALERLSEGLDLENVVIELAVLRDCMLQVWERERTPGMARPEVRFLNRSVDRAITASVERYVAARDRTLKALDRISAATLESRRLDDLLERLLGVLVETTPSVDTGAILLREGDHLLVRAAVGLDHGLEGERVAIGDGLAGRIAAQRRPCLLSAAESGPVRDPLLRAQALRAVYGVPLTEDGMVVGVALIGSVTAADFSDQDKRLFQTMAGRATSGIVQHQLREDLERRAAEQAAILESIPDAVLVGDADGITMANGAALALLGVRTVDEINQHARELEGLFRIRRADTGEPVPAAERSFARALRGESVTEELLLRNPHTHEDMVLRVAAAPVRTGGQVVGGVLIASDVTGRRERDQERQRLYEEAKQAVADREHALAVVSHDLRNPLSTIAMSASILRDRPDDVAQTRKAAASIGRAVHRMNRLISDLLDFSSLQANRLGVQVLPIDAATVVEEAVETVRADAEARGVHIAVDAQPTLVRADRDRLVQALGNLLSNAVKVTPQGSSVATRVERLGDEVRFSVTDSGPGITPEAQPHLFEPYWRGTDPSYKGTGLGLAIARGIVEAHRGRIWVETAPGAGATFHFSVPAGVPAPPSTSI
jgi:signal transduction histidine kinase/putative methionine-R-sulfoxide reductase with GAF domain